MRSMEGEVTVHMKAPVDAVWDLVSDVTRIGEFSPETFEAEWVNEDTGAALPRVGARFRGHVKRNGIGPIYWTPCRVTASEPGRLFEFVIDMGGPVNTWGYRLTESNGGTDVTEYFRLTPNPMLKLYWAVLGPLRGKTNERGMRTTLERMKAVVEHD